MKKITRRELIKKSAASILAAGSAPYFIPSSALGLDGSVSPSDRITCGIIGYGGRCQAIIEQILHNRDAQFVALSDCRTSRRERGKKMVDDFYGNQDYAAYEDFFDLLARDDIDAVMIETGDRWHASISIYAAKAGKDVWCEKPMTLTIAEGRALSDTIERYGAVFQCSHQRRSVDAYRFVVEAVRKGMIGEVQTITTALFGGRATGVEKPAEIPPGWGNYDRWVGPTPYAGYSNERVRYWGSNWDLGGGSVTGMGVHLVDIAQWGIDTELTAPIEYEGNATFPEEGFANTPVTGEVRCRYANGIRLNIPFGQTGDFDADRWTKFEGTEGWIKIMDHGSALSAEPKSLLRSRGVLSQTWDDNRGHFQNFLDAIRTGSKTACPAEISHRTTTICHVANICLRLGRPVKWNPETEQFVDDAEANRMISRAMRAPWHV